MCTIKVLKNFLLFLCVFLGVFTMSIFSRANPSIVENTISPVWQSGDFDRTEELASSFIAKEQEVDRALHFIVLAQIVKGKYAKAITTYQQIASQYKYLDQLNEPMLWAYIHHGDMAGAYAFAKRRGLLRDSVIAARLQLALENPLKVEISDVAEIPFTKDALTPFMPGISVQLNGRNTVARLDTGGSFLHVTPTQADMFGIKTTACERGFYSLIQGGICHGIAKTLNIGSVHLHNVPVAVLDNLPTERFESASGVEFGPIIGTNILEQFLSTLDRPGERLILSERGNTMMREKHLSRIKGEAREVPFALWADHYMIAQGQVGTIKPVNFFVDSGAVAVNEEQEQSSLLASKSVLSSWHISQSKSGQIVDISEKIGLGGAVQEKTLAFVVTDSQWKAFGNWGGIKVDALISWGFLKHFAWTIDFDRHVYTFTKV